MSGNDDHPNIDGIVENLYRQLLVMPRMGILEICAFPADVLQHWQDHTTTAIVLLASGRVHYLADHPEMIHYEDRILRTLIDPTEISQETRTHGGAVFYRAFSDKTFIRIPVWISDHSEKKNALITAYRTTDDERQRMQRARERVVWRKSGEIE